MYYKWVDIYLTFLTKGNYQKMAIRKGLGKGLGALISGAEEEYENATAAAVFDNPTHSTQSSDIKPSDLLIAQVVPNTDQPRKHFDEVAMSDLINSIRVHGVISPIIVVKRMGEYMIIAGERRWRAAKAAGLRTIPAIVRDYTPQQVKELSLIENLQREDLNPIETANAIKELMTEYHFTQEQVADRIGKKRSTVANILRLLNLSPAVIAMVAAGRLSEGHARCIVTVEDAATQRTMAEAACNGRMTVRDFEKLVKNYFSPQKAAASQPSQSIELKDLVTRMQKVFSTKVGALGNDKKGRIFIDYYTRDDLDRLVELVHLLEELNGRKDK